MTNLLLYAAILLATVIIYEPVYAQCSATLALAAEKNSNEVKNWQDVYNAYKLYEKCDDGSIAESYSDAVAILLANKWQQTSHLNTLANSNKGFRDFVLRHVDCLMSPDEAARISKSASKACPEKSKDLCQSILVKLKQQCG